MTNQQIKARINFLNILWGELLQKIDNLGDSDATLVSNRYWESRIDCLLNEMDSLKRTLAVREEAKKIRKEYLS